MCGKVLLLVGFLMACGSLTGWAQRRDSVHLLQGLTVDGDTMPHREIPEVHVFPHRQFDSKRQERQYSRLVQRVKKVYPYAREAARLLDVYEQKYLASGNEKERRKYLKGAEKELMDRYGPELKKFSVADGRILIRLIDRETGNTSYEIIKDVKGGVSAVFWQGIARLFGNNLKDEYDPVFVDREIEQIIFFIEAGVL